MRNRRFAVTGQPAEVGFVHTPERGAVYVDATDADDATRKAGVFFDAVREVREVPHDAGRGWLWRLWRWVRGRGMGDSRPRRRDQ